jgi:hypothetical protein
VGSNWHEVKVSGDYAYAVSEGADSTLQVSGLQIIDLRFLPDSAPYKFYMGDGVIDSMLLRAHSITADDNYLYINGSNVPGVNGGVLILDISDPWNPVYAGQINTRYCHDSFVSGDTIFTSESIDGMFTVYDISDKANPIALATQPTLGSLCHNSGLNSDKTVLFVTVEVPGIPLAAYSIADLNNIQLIDTFYNYNFPQSEVHNVRVINDFLVNPSYGSQLTIADGARPDNLIETANYTTGSALCWEADPYLNSGNIIATDKMECRLYIFQPVYQRACYLEGIVTDSISGFPLFNVLVSIDSAGVTKQTNLIGEYKTGYADSGLYVITFSASGYYTKQVTVSLQNGILTTLNVELTPAATDIVEVRNTGVTIYPNPAGNTIKVSTDRIIEHYKISDASGRVVAEKNISGDSVNSIDISHLSRGIYLIELKGNGFSSSEFFTKK